MGETIVKWLIISETFRVNFDNLIGYQLDAGTRRFNYERGGVIQFLDATGCFLIEFEFEELDHARKMLKSLDLFMLNDDKVLNLYELEKNLLQK